MMSESCKDGDKGVQSLLTELTEIVNKRQIDLDNREAALEKERKAFEEEKKVFGAGSGSSSDILSLNVGGKRIDVLRRTLTLIDGSMLASKFSGRWDDSLEKNKDGNFFIDQPHDLFELLVDFLRRKACETPDSTAAYPPSKDDFAENPKRFDDFARMLDYYGVTHGVYTIEMESFFAGESIEADHYFYEPGVTVKSSSLGSIRLTPTTTGICQVSSFEVRVRNNITDFSVGWMKAGLIPDVSSSVAPRVGMFEWSVGFDLVRFEIHSSGDMRGLPKNGISIEKEDTIIIRCEYSSGKFFLNGKEVFCANVRSCCDGCAEAAISGKGEWQIIKVTYDFHKDAT